MYFRIRYENKISTYGLPKGSEREDMHSLNKRLTGACYTGKLSTVEQSEAHQFSRWFPLHRGAQFRIFRWRVSLLKLSNAQTNKYHSHHLQITGRLLKHVYQLKYNA